VTQQGPKYVYDFAEGNRELKDLLGGKGANLAEMTNLGLPVPPGFTITTEACKAYLESGSEPPELGDEISAHLATLEASMGKRLGDPDDPLLVSVRSGAKFSMPGMMETVLNVGLNDESVHGLARQAAAGGDHAGSAIAATRPSPARTSSSEAPQGTVTVVPSCSRCSSSRQHLVRTGRTSPPPGRPATRRGQRSTASVSSR